MFWAIIVLPKPLRPTRTRLRASRKKVQRQRALDDVAFDLGGPGPIEVGHGLEAFDAADPQAALQAAARAFGDFRFDQLFEDLMSATSGLWWRARGSHPVARARRTSRSAGVERRGYCSVIVVVLSAGEFIVGLQIMRADIERLGLRMVAEIERQRCGARLAAQQESDGGGARRVALQRFDDGAAQCGGAILLQQFQSVERSELPADSPCAKARSRSVLLSGTACSRRPAGVEWKALRLILSTAS